MKADFFILVGDDGRLVVRVAPGLPVAYVESKKKREEARRLRTQAKAAAEAERRRAGSAT